MAESNTDMDSSGSLFQHRLVRDCQVKVLECLSINDLLQVYQVNKYFKELSGCIIGKRLVSVRLYEKSDILNVIGKAIRKIKCVGRNWDFVLDGIIENCQPNLLTEIEIDLYPYDESCEYSRRCQQLTIVPSLQKLSINLKTDSEEMSRTVDNELFNIAANAFNLKVLRITGTGFRYRWLRSEYMMDLCEIRMRTKQYIPIDDLKYFIRKHPKLQIFSFFGGIVSTLNAQQDAQSIIGNCLSEYCKSLKAFVFTDNECIDADRYNFLTSLPKLNLVSLAWHTLTEHPLMPFASRHCVKKLEIEFNDFDYVAVNVWQLEYSVDSELLKMFKVIWNDIRNEANFELLLHNNAHIARYLATVEEITLRSGILVSNVHKLLELTPNVRMLSISKVQFLHLPVEIRRIVRTLERNCHLIVSIDQSRELDVYNRRGTLTVSLDTKRDNKRIFLGVSLS